MRAKLVLEAMSFERGLDPKKSMGIGRLLDIPVEKIHNVFACVRNYSLDDLQDIYRRIQTRSNIKLDGVPIEDLSYNDWVIFNNKIANGINGIRRRKAKTNFTFKPGDLIKVEHNGKNYFGIYDKVDRKGRIKANGHGITLLFSPERYTKATKKEIEEFENYLEKILLYEG